MKSVPSFSADIKWSISDFFIHESLRENSDIFYRARILALVLIVDFSAALAAGLTLLFTPLPEQSTEFIQIFILFCIVPQFAILYLLKTHGAFALCSLLLVAQAFVTVFAATFLTGGPFESSTAQFAGVPCLMAFYFGGRRRGIAATIVTLLTLITLIAMQWAGFHFPETVHASLNSLITTVILPVNFGIVMLLALAYELTFFLVKKEHDEVHGKLVELAKTDPLTGLPNRRIFDETLSAKIALCGKLMPPRNFGLCYLDLDGFKPINDQFGHDVGDEVLNTISQRLRSALRGADFIGRHGGDEFLILLDSVQDTVNATALLKRFLQLIEQPIETNAGPIRVSGSLGFAIFPTHGHDLATLQKAADDAMYEAKRNHSGFVIYKSANPGEEK